MIKSHPRAGRCACVFALAVLLSGCAPTESAEIRSEYEKSYEPVCVENRYLRLSMDETDGRFTLYDKEKNVTVSGYPDGTEEDDSIKGAARVRIKSALHVTVYNESANDASDLFSFSDSVNMGGLTVEAGDKEIVARYRFDSESLTVPVHYTLKDRRLLVTVVPEEIREEGESVLKTLAIHPYFYSAGYRESGNLIVPDGSGALIPFNHRNYAAKPYSQKIYGRDVSESVVSSVEVTKPAVMTAFGIERAGGVMLGIVTEGAADAYINASPGLSNVSYNAVYPSFDLMNSDLVTYSRDNRTDVRVYAKHRKRIPLLQVAYEWSEGPGQSYTDLAKMYRAYLTERYGLKEMQTPSAPLSLDFYMAALKKKSFLGVTYRGIQKFSDFATVRRNLEALPEGSAADIRLFGWTKEDVKGSEFLRVSPLTRLGGKNDLNALMEAAAKRGDLYFDGDIVNIFDRSYFRSSRNYARNLRNAPMKVQNFNLATDFPTDSYGYAVSVLKMPEFAANFARGLRKLGIGAVSVSGTDRMYTDFTTDNYSLTRTQFAKEKALQVFSNDFKVAISRGDEYLLAHADKVFDLPAGDSKYDLVSEKIPFYAIALHGLLPLAQEPINESPNPKEAYLAALEAGTSLAFRFGSDDAEDVRYSTADRLFAGSFAAWKDEVVRMIAESGDFLRRVSARTIEQHEKLETGVYKTTFSSGDYVIVNYNKEPVRIGNGTVEALSAVFGKVESR